MVGIVQTALRLIYPPQCLLCRDMVETDFALCGTCWRDTPFIGGLVCDACGTPLPGDNTGESVLCDSCLSHPRPWAQGRAALSYRDNARRLVLGLKHNDRHDIAAPAAIWMARVLRPIVEPGALVTPVPLHWSRRLKRRYNQSALLAASLATELGLPYCPDLLVRTGRTPSLNGNREERRTILERKIRLHHGREAWLDRYPSVLVIDDVLTTGATLSACTEALYMAGAERVCIGVLARVHRDD